MCLRATQWSQVKILTATGAVVNALSAIGAFYYVVLQGVATPGLITILVVTVVMTGLLGYYYFSLSKQA